VQKKLALTAQQTKKLQDISAAYWPERRKIAGKELADMESSSNERMQAYRAKAEKSRALASGSSTRKATFSGFVMAGAGGGRKTFSPEVVQALERQWDNARKEIEAVLTPEQLGILKDLNFRTFAFGAGVMFEQKVLEKLGLTAKQRDELRRLEPQLQSEKDRRLRAVTRERIEKTLALLTPQQQAKLREKQSLDKRPEMDCSVFPYPKLPSHVPGNGAADELGLSPEQRDNVRKIITAHWKVLGALQRDEQKLPLDSDKAFKAIGEKRQQEMADLHKKIEAALTPQQFALFNEMAIQNMVAPSLHYRGRIVKAEATGIGLTEQQQAALRDIEAEYVDKPEQIYCDLTDKALTAFTPAQQEKLRAEVDRRGW
jgi:hypothetical protein